MASKVFFFYYEMLLKNISSSCCFKRIVQLAKFRFVVTRNLNPLGLPHYKCFWTEPSIKIYVFLDSLIALQLFRI